MSGLTVIDVLASRPRGELSRLRDALLARQANSAARLRRIEVEMAQLDEARRLQRGHVQGSVIALVREYVLAAGRPVRPAEVMDAIRERVYASDSAVYNALSRLAGAGTLVRGPQGYLGAATERNPGG
jgi:hypothetical protein